MKKLALIFLFILINKNLFSQDLKKIDKIIASYMKAESVESLAKRIDYDFETEIEKVRAIYTWIALNIEYNTLKYNSLTPPDFIIYTTEPDFKRARKRKENRLINKAFKNKRGVCYENALLFNKLCNLINLESEMIYGYSKSSVYYIGVIPKNKNHVWNAVKIKNNWLLFDVTYGAGYSYKGVWQKKIDLSYFNVKKEKLRLTHFPSSKFWQRYLNQKTLEEFCYEPFYQNAFLKYKIGILEPNTGEITVNNSDKIHLKIKNPEDITNIKYIFSDDDKVRIPVIKNKNSLTDIYFKNPKRNTNIHIYIENELALEYKIKLH
ncbi:transglutaminase domain-containing protein [Tenacibaculum ovolyticum]|uniref:transglutaminase domain-containing protein n=1 Tax=Tenacibaculum ovolyticum TaxID=104270 RepID=UPI003BAAFADB